MRCYNILLRSFRLLAAKRRFHLTHAIVMSIMLFAPVGIYADDIPVDEAHFPDANFRAFVKANTANGDDILTEAEAAKITTFGNGLKGLGITDLTGLKYFSNLTTLYCQDNSGLTSIDLSGNTKLQELNITGCKVTSLDFSNNPDMRGINCAQMHSLTSINLSNCSKLRYVTVADNLLTELDVTHCPELTFLSCYGNKLPKIDLSQNTALDTLMAFNNKSLTSIDVSKNTELLYLSVYGNNMTSVDVSMLPKLKVFYCFSNKLPSVDVTKNTELVDFCCYGNKLTSLDVTNNTKLQNLLCFTNQLTSLDVSQNTALTGLSCYGNKLTTLDLSNNSAMTHLDCHSNRLTSLTLHPNHATQMLFVSVYDNALAFLDLSSFTKLVENYHNTSFQNASVATQKRSMALYTDGTDAYMKVAAGIDAAKISDAKINISGVSSDITLTVGEKTADGLVPLKFSNGSVRKRLFEWNGTTAKPITITYKYSTGLSLANMDVMDVTDTIECYLLPMSQEYGSVCLPYDAVLPEGATAYAVSATNVKAGSDNNTATLTPIATAGEVVAANTPMLIHRSSDSYSLFAFNRGTGTAKAADTNLLLGTKNTSIDNSDTYYVLGVNSTTGSKHYKQLGFWRSTNTKIGTWRAYLDLTASSASAARGFVFVLDDSPTSISRIRTAESSADALWYTLDGTVLSQKPTEKGIYIHGGRKIVVTH